MCYDSMLEYIAHSRTESPKGFRNRLIGISRNNNNHLKGHMQRPLSMTIFHEIQCPTEWVTVNGLLSIGPEQLAPPVIYHQHMAEGPFSPSSRCLQYFFAPYALQCRIALRSA